MDTSVWRSFHKVLRDRLENAASVVALLSFVGRHAKQRTNICKFCGDHRDKYLTNSLQVFYVMLFFFSAAI